jgi:hypothetical protein
MEAGVVQPSPDSRSASPGRRDSNLMRSVNTNLRQRSETLFADEPIAFFCECGSLTCYSPIWKSAAAFDTTTIEQPGWLLYEGHEPSALWHRREPLPTRTSLRAGAAAGDRHVEHQQRISSDDDHARPRHARLTVLGALLPSRDANRGPVKATHA